MPAYALFDNVEVHDFESLAEYVANVHATVHAFGGRYLVVGGEVRNVEGDGGLAYPVLLEFPDMEAAQAWYDSEEYAPLKKLRHAASESTAVFFESAPSPLLDVPRYR
jgi:uncharacterized protein (DUF1330 family)